MKKLSFMFILLFAFYSYAAESKFQRLDGYDIFQEQACSYTTKDGKKGVMLESTLCVSIYKTDIKDLEKAYTEYRKENMELNLPEKPPVKRKDENKIHIRLIYKGADYNILFEKKDDGVYVYSHLGLFSERYRIGEVKAEYESDKLKFYVSKSLLAGENLKNTVSNVVVKKVYTVKDSIYYNIYEVNTPDIDEAYKIINEYRNSTYGTNYPLSLDENSNTKRISESYVATDYNELEVGIFTLELKKKGDKVIGFVEITGN